jgi:cell division protein FtsZ
MQNAADPNANVIFGAVIGKSMSGDMRVTVIGTGFDHVPGRGGRRESSHSARPGARDRSPQISDPQHSTLEISDDDIDVPPFLR